MVGDEPELVDVTDMVSGLPLNEWYADAVVKAATKNGLDKSAFVLAVLFRDMDEAPQTVADAAPLRFVGKFEFPFPKRGDHVGRDDQEWLGIDEAYCLGGESVDEDPTDLNSAPSNGFLGSLKRLFGKKNKS